MKTLYSTQRHGRYHQTMSGIWHQIAHTVVVATAAPYPHHGLDRGHDRHFVLKVYVRSLAKKLNLKF